MSVAQSHIAELRKQNAALLAENEKLKRQLAAWPGRAFEHGLQARARERKLIRENPHFLGQPI
jgi:hypothetical protein